MRVHHYLAGPDQVNVDRLASGVAWDLLLSVDLACQVAVLLWGVLVAAMGLSDVPHNGEGGPALLLVFP